eukprot:2748181-Prymnesium_polylepis.1
MQVVIATSIGCIVAFQLLYPDVTAKTSPTPWRDGAKLLVRSWTLACYANHFVMISWARFFHAGLGALTFYLGVAMAAVSIFDRIRATMKKDVVEVNEGIARSSFGMPLAAYMRMSALNIVPHNLLRCAYSPLYVALWGYTAEAVDSRWLVGELFVGL